MEKQKAKLALHTWDAAAKGSDAGPIWIAGKPNDSALMQRLRLPLDDEEHMPPKDKPQPAAPEIELLAHWIARGASRTATVEELHLPPALATAAAALPGTLPKISPPHDDAAWLLNPAAVARARAPLAAKVTELQQRFPGALSYESRTAAALHFTAAGLGGAFGDAELAMLAALRDQLVRLDVSSTAITDASAAVLASLTRLRVLRAGFTRVGDRTVAAVSALPELEVLALNHTAITGAAADALAGLRTVRALHLAGTPAAAAAQAAGLPVVAATEGLE